MVSLFHLLLFLHEIPAFTVSQIPSTGTPPPALSFSRLAYSELQLFSFGGQLGNDYSNELWSFSFCTYTWKKIGLGTQIIPSPRILPVFVGANDILLLFGGQTITGGNGEMWTYNVTTMLWSLVTQQGAVPNARTNVAFTIVGNSTLYIYGGDTYVGTDNSLYKLDISSLVWTLIPTRNTPSVRSGCQIIYYENAIYMWGGSVNDTNMYRLELTGDTWQVLQTSGEPPLARQVFPMFAWEGYIYVFPGYIYNNTGPATGCFRMSVINYAWTQIVCDIDRVVWAYSGAESYMTLFGGVGAEGKSNELLLGTLGDPITYLTASAKWIYPPARQDHSMLVSKSYIWLFGGYSSGS